MRSLADVQADFAAALLNPAAIAPAEVTGPNGEPTRRRFEVYRNNVLSALGNALESAFPAVVKLVGEDFFRVMARTYVMDNPPQSPVLLDYGKTFPDFIERFEPAATLPYLPDVARLEQAWREAYHAADAQPMDPTALGSVDPGRLNDVRLSIHPSFRLVESRFPIVTIWRMNVSDQPIRPVDFAVGEDALIVRPDADVEVRTVPLGGLSFVTALAAGDTLGAAAAAGQASSDAFDLAGNIAGLIEAGAFTGIRQGDA